MSEFIVCEEPFKLGWAERAPSHQEGECFLLCQSGTQSRNLIYAILGVEIVENSGLDFLRRSKSMRVTRESPQRLRKWMRSLAAAIISPRHFRSLRSMSLHFLAGLRITRAAVSMLRLQANAGWHSGCSSALSPVM